MGRTSSCLGICSFPPIVIHTRFTWAQDNVKKRRRPHSLAIFADKYGHIVTFMPDDVNRRNM